MALPTMIVLRDVSRQMFIHAIQGNGYATKPAEIHFNGCTFTGVDLRNIRVDAVVKFYSCTFVRVDFTGFNGPRVDFDSCLLRGVMDNYTTVLGSFSNCTFEALDDKGRCPKCYQNGVFIKMALCCPTHGVFAGC